MQSNPMESGATSQTPVCMDDSLSGCTIVITRPAGTGRTLARQVRRLGGVPLLLPGMSLRAAPDATAALAQWRESLHDDVLVFTSPAAVRYALALAPCVTHATVIAVGKGTARALHRHGIDAQVPVSRQDSEGVLQLPSLQRLVGKRIALVTAPGGRGLLQEQLVVRGASLREVHVYGRGAPRLNRRHFDAVLHLPDVACVLLSSGEAIQHLMERLPEEARQRLCQATAIVSSERIAEQARRAGFKRFDTAASAGQADLLAAAIKVCSHARH
jgi:uroporphyrinogen-III synthase